MIACEVQLPELGNYLCLGKLFESRLGLPSPDCISRDHGVFIELDGVIFADDRVKQKGQNKRLSVQGLGALIKPPQSPDCLGGQSW